VKRGSEEEGYKLIFQQRKKRGKKGPHRKAIYSIRLSEREGWRGFHNASPNLRRKSNSREGERVRHSFLLGGRGVGRSGRDFRGKGGGGEKKRRKP